MPQYTYRCKKCQQTVDVFRSISSTEQKPTELEFEPTEECKHEEMERIINSSHWSRGDNWRGRKGHWE